MPKIFNTQLTEEEKIKYNIANYKPRVETIEMGKPNIIDKFINFLANLFYL
jgi:hypothetical protein